jgi:subtilisin-like proprotein convertase family protein
VLHNRRGGEADALVQTFDVSSVSGQSAAGDWPLTVSDRSRVDSCVLRSWQLILTPGP